MVFTCHPNLVATLSNGEMTLKIEARPEDDVYVDQSFVNLLADARSQPYDMETVVSRILLVLRTIATPGLFARRTCPSEFCPN